MFSSRNLQVHNYLFFDECKNANNLSSYNSSIPISGAQGTATISYDSNNNSYKMNGNGNYIVGFIIPSLNGVTGYKITGEFKTNGDSYFCRSGFVIHNKNATSSTMNDVYQIMSTSRMDFTPYNVNAGNGTVVIQTQSADNNNWTKIVLTVPNSGTTYNVKVYKMDGTLLSDNNVTGTVTADNDIQMGIVYMSERRLEAYCRNIKAEKL